MRAIELFSGIGGLGLALGGRAAVVAAYDQDADAARAYAANLGLAPIRLDLAHVSAGEILRHEADLWLLSPPCQPFTRRGRGRDLDDPRSAGLVRAIALLPEARPRALLLENVVGFAGSRAHALLVATLGALGHETATVRVCPSEHGAPVRRPREVVVSSARGLAPLPPPDPLPGALGEHLDPAPDEELRVPPGLAPRLEGHAWRGDGPLATFTRSYGRAIAGAGPVLPVAGGLRYFSPAEILRLHGFPTAFAFPAEMPLRTRLRLAGNAVHVGAMRRAASMLDLG